MLQANNSTLIHEIKIFDNNTKFPYLSKLALRLSNISSSSAFIERYFSICGFVQNDRNQNMSQDLFIKRCFLRANIKILNEIAGIEFKKAGRYFKKIIFKSFFYGFFHVLC